MDLKEIFNFEKRGSEKKQIFGFLVFFQEDTSEQDDGDPGSADHSSCGRDCFCL